MSDLIDYEREVIDEIAEHIVHPGTIQQALDVVGWPLEKVLTALGGSDSKTVQKVVFGMTEGIQTAIAHTISVGHKLTSERDLISEFKKHAVHIASPAEIATREDISLEVLDKVADSYKLSNALIIGTQGFMTGIAITLAELIPVLVPGAIVTDVYASLTLLGRHASQVASSYGYSPTSAANMRHLLSAMTPVHKRNKESESFLRVKQQVTEALRDAGRQLADAMARAAAEAAAASAKATVALAEEAAEKEAALLVRAIIALAERLGLELTEKELAALVPLAGGALNAGLNVTFQQIGHAATKDYYRRMFLAQRYGEQVVDKLIEQAVQRKRAS